MYMILSKMFDWFTNKNKRLQNKIEKYIDLEKQKDILKSDIDELADYFYNYKQATDALLKSESDQSIKDSVQERYDNYISSHIVEIGDLKRRRDKIESEMNNLIKGDEEFLNLVKIEKENRIYRSILSKYRNGDISLEACDNLLKAVQHKYIRKEFKNGKWEYEYEIPKQEREKNLKKWFGNSKIVDETRKPLIVYTGTDADFSEFKVIDEQDSEANKLGTGFYFTNNREMASNYGNSVMPCFIKIEKPFIIEAGKKSKDVKKLFDIVGLDKKYEDYETDLLLLGDIKSKLNQSKVKLNSVLQKLGFDGIKFIKRDRSEFVVFNSNQIKSAIGNSGKFDPNENDITKSFNLVKYADNLVFNERGLLLLLKRSELDESKPGYFTIPGGHVDLGEEFEEAAKRELLEEAGIKSENVIEIGEYEDDKCHIKYFRSDVVNVEPVLQEEEIWSYEWIDPKEIDKYKLPFNMGENITKILYPVKHQIISIKKSFESGLISEKQRSELIGVILEKSKIHKYIRKELKNGKWEYIYEENKNILSNKENFENFLQETLRNFYDHYFNGLKSKNVKIHYYDGGESINASVNYEMMAVENGRFMKKINGVYTKVDYDENNIRIDIPNRIFKQKNIDEDKIKTTLMHEFAHIGQYNFLSYEEIKFLRGVRIKSNKMSSYSPNILEAQAEAVTINEFGKTNHSYKGAKDSQEYRAFLDSYLYMIENPLNFDINHMLNIVKDYTISDIKKSEESDIEKAKSFKNNKTEDDICVDDFFKHKFEEKNKTFYDAVEKYLKDKWKIKTKKEFDDKFSKESKLREIKIDKIIPTQEYVSRKILDEKMENDHSKTSKIQLLKFDGNYYLYDGHHRTSALVEEGYKEVKDEVLNLNKIDGFEKDIEKYLPENYDLYDIVDKSEMSILNKAFDEGNINEEQYNTLIEKAWKKHPIGTVITRKDGQKYKKVSETGNSAQDWKLVSKDKAGMAKDKPEQSGKAKQVDDKNTNQPKENLSDSAKNASETALNNAIKQSPDPEVRQSAHEELQRREEEEKPKEKENVGDNSNNEKEVRSKLKEVNDNLSKLNDYLNEKYKDLSILSRGREKFKDEDYKKFISLKESLTEKLISITSNNKKEKQEESNDYKMTHRPTDNGPSSDNVTKGDLSLPSDFYDNPEKYGNMKDISYKESFDILKKIKDNPDSEITIYRATIGDSINEGDWVTLSKNYAKSHNESNLDNKGKIISLKVKAKDVIFAGDDIREFGFFPKNKNIQKSEEDKIHGGKADNLTVDQIAEKHGVSVKKILKQLKKGVKVEMEHTDDKQVALEIARDHVTEFVDYYTRLEKMENEAKKENKENE